QWFPGYHLDVGGGATVNGKSAGSGSLSDVTPQWMMDEARTKCLGISNPDAKFLPFHPDPEGIRHKSDWRTTPLIKRPRQYASSMSQNTQSGANVSPPLEAAPFKRVWIW